MSENDRDAPRSANLSVRSSTRSPPANLQAKDLQKLELSFIELNKERARQKEWKKLIRDMVFQRGKIPLLLAVEAGNQSMVRELLSAQTAEQLKVIEHCVDCMISISYQILYVSRNYIAEPILKKFCFKFSFVSSRNTDIYLHYIRYI